MCRIKVVPCFLSPPCSFCVSLAFCASCVAETTRRPKARLACRSRWAFSAVRFNCAAVSSDGLSSSSASKTLWICAMRGCRLERRDRLTPPLLFSLPHPIHHLGTLTSDFFPLPSGEVFNSCSVCTNVFAR